MTNILHCSDLHLSVKEKEYSFSVLEEIMTLSNANKCDWLIFAGDIFDSFYDLEKLRFDFKKTLSQIDIRTKIILIAGNHEEIGGGVTDISKFNLSDRENFFMTEGKRVKFIRDAAVEFILMPFRKNRNDLSGWNIPEKKSFRIAVAHGTIPGITYNGNDEENDPAFIDSSVFIKNRVDYAAMGHIHARSGISSDQLRMEYPGSARVWRKNEFGEHGANLITLNGNISVKFMALKKAGQFREYEIPLLPDGTPETDMECIDTWNEADWINFKFSGLIEDENSVKALSAELGKKYGKNIRKFTTDAEGIDVMSGISENPLAKSFLEILEKKKHLYDHDLFMKMRLMGLKEIKSVLEARK
jgi:DNA repair exonuclease SbcCD nuclease subunit